MKNDMIYYISYQNIIPNMETFKRKIISLTVFIFVSFVIASLLLIFLFLNSSKIPYIERDPVKHIFKFTESQEFTWATFDNYIKSELGFSLSNPSTPMTRSHDKYINLINTLPDDDLTFHTKEDVKITIDLGKNGRFMVNNGSKVTFLGYNTSAFIIKNGEGVWDGNLDNENENWSNAGGIRQNSGIIYVKGCKVHINDSNAEGAVGMYLLGGDFSLMDNEDNSGCLYFNNNHASRTACGGLSMWDANFTIFSKNGLVEIKNCTSPHHCGGFVAFGGVVELKGDNSYIHTIECTAGHKNGKWLYAGGIQIGAWSLVPVLKFTGLNSALIANNCVSGSGSGIYIGDAIFEINTDNPVLKATNNLIVDYGTSNPAKDILPCAIAFYPTGKITVNDDKLVKVEAYGNTCRQVSDCDQVCGKDIYEF